MDFSLSEEQQDVQQLAAKILGQEVTVERLKTLEAGDDRFDDKLWQQLAEAGLLGVAIDERYGGLGFDFETLCLLIEEVGKTVAAVPVVPALASAALTLQQFAELPCPIWPWHSQPLGFAPSLFWRQLATSVDAVPAVRVDVKDHPRRPTGG